MRENMLITFFASANPIATDAHYAGDKGQRLPRPLYFPGRAAAKSMPNLFHIVSVMKQRFVHRGPRRARLALDTGAIMKTQRHHTDKLILNIILDQFHIRSHQSKSQHIRFANTSIMPGVKSATIVAQRFSIFCILI